MLEKVREESWDEVFVLEATRSDLPRLFFRAYSAGGCGCDSIDNGDISRYYGIRSAKKV
jgi:hypothetical protein